MRLVYVMMYCSNVILKINFMKPRNKFRVVTWRAQGGHMGGHSPISRF